MEDSKVSRCRSSLDNHILADLLSVAILIIELLCPHKVGGVVQMAASATKLAIYRKLLQAREIHLGFALAFVEQVFAAVIDEGGDCVYEPISSDDTMVLSPPRLLVSEFNEQLVFPQYFVILYDFLSFLVSNMEASEQGWTQNPVDIALERLLTILPMLDAEGFDLLLPYLCPLFELPDTRFDATLKLFGEISKRLGPQKTTSLFLKPILVTMEQPPNPTAHARLMYRTFIQKLIRGFGLQVFLDRFVLFLIDALVSAHNPSAEKADDTVKTTVSQETDAVFEQDAGVLVNSASGDGSDVTQEINVFSKPSLTAADVQDELLGNVEAEVNLEAGDDVPQQTDTGLGRVEQQDSNVITQKCYGDCIDAMRYVEDNTNESAETTSQMDVPDSWPSKDERLTHEPLFHQFSDQMSQVGAVDVTKVAMDTMIWLSKFLGPVLTSSHLVLPLLKSLTAVQPVGDPIVLKNSPIMKMLMFILDTYGNHYFLEQYLPFAAESVSSNYSVTYVCTDLLIVYFVYCM